MFRTACFWCVKTMFGRGMTKSRDQVAVALLVAEVAEGALARRVVARLHVRRDRRGRCRGSASHDVPFGVSASLGADSLVRAPG